MADERGTKKRLAEPHPLQRDAIAGEHRIGRPLWERGSCAIDIQAVPARGEITVLEHGQILFDPFDAAHAHDIADSSQGFAFAFADDGAMKPGWDESRV